MTKMTALDDPKEVPEIPEELPVPEKTPEVIPPSIPEDTPLPPEEPGVFPIEEPFQPDIPDEIPPSVQ